MAKAGCWLACIIATGLSSGARAQVPPCAAHERNAVFKLEVGPRTATAATTTDTDEEPEKQSITEGGSAVLLDTWHDRQTVLFLTAGHVVANLAGAPPDGQHPWLVRVDDYGQELFRLPGEVPCKSIRHLQTSVRPGADPEACTTDPQQDLIVVRATFDPGKALHRQYLACIPDLLLFPFGLQKLVGFGFPYNSSGPRKLDETGPPQTFDGDANSARHRFRGQPLPGMSGGAVFAVLESDKTRRLAGVVRELRVTPVLDPASRTTVIDERAGATVFAMGTDRRSFLARKVMLELCQQSSFPTLREQAFLSELARLPCVSPRVGKVLTLIEAGLPQDDLGHELDALRHDPKTRLTDFDFLQLETLAAEYPKVRAKLRVTALHNVLDFLQVGQTPQLGTLLSEAPSSAEFMQRSRFIPLRQLYLSLFPTADVIRSLAQSDEEKSRALITYAGHALSAVQAESQGAQLSPATAQLGLEALGAFEEARALTKSPLLNPGAVTSWQDSLVGEAVLAYSLALKGKLPQREALLDKALASLTEATSTKHLGIDESKNARALSWVYTLNGQHGDALKAYLRAEQFQPWGNAATLSALIDRADVNKQISSAQARSLRSDLLQKGYADAVQSEAIMDPAAPITFDLQKLPAFRIKPKNITIPSAPKLWAYYKLPDEPVLRRRDDSA